jgi:hypothetical protein
MTLQEQIAALQAKAAALSTQQSAIEQAQAMLAEPSVSRLVITPIQDGTFLIQANGRDFRCTKTDVIESILQMCIGYAEAQITEINDAE